MLGYYFASTDRKLGFGDGRVIRVGRTHKVSGEPRLCAHGLHASKRPLDALEYASGPIAYRVRLGGTVIHGDDKSVATEREYLQGADATDVLRRFARLCALDVAHLIEAPEREKALVIRYLKTGDESLRYAARAAARAAVWAAARAAAWAAARAAAWAATGDAADAARDAAGAAARDAARDAAGAAAGAAAAKKQNRRLAQMLARLWNSNARG